jgi:hypothetical protein
MTSMKTAALAFAASLVLATSAFAQGAGGGGGAGGGSGSGGGGGGSGGNDSAGTGAAGSVYEQNRPGTTGSTTRAPTAAESGTSSAGSMEPSKAGDPGPRR